MNLNPDPRVYFVRPVGETGPIKVGQSHQVAVRLREYCKWSPVELELIATFPIPDGLNHSHSANPGRCSRFERRFHQRYADFRLHHEWFAAHSLILADIEAINAGTFDPACLPEWQIATNEFIRREYKARTPTAHAGRSVAPNCAPARTLPEVRNGRTP